MVTNLKEKLKDFFDDIWFVSLIVLALPLLVLVQILAFVKGGIWGDEET